MVAVLSLFSRDRWSGGHLHSPVGHAHMRMSARVSFRFNDDAARSDTSIVSEKTFAQQRFCNLNNVFILIKRLLYLHVILLPFLFGKQELLMYFRLRKNLLTKSK